TALAPSEKPDSKNPQTRLSCSSDTRGPMSVEDSMPGPTRILSARAETPSTTLSKISFSTYRREPGHQHCPELKKIGLAEPAIAESRSTSPKTTFGDLPPNSRETFFKLPEAACRISFPTSVEPVKATLSTSG